MIEQDALLAPWRERWGLEADGEALTTASSVLQPVRRGHDRLFLKLAASPEERAGNAVLTWWRGHGAAAVLESDENAVLVERAMGGGDLAELARSGPDGDDGATRILCRTGTTVHGTFDRPRPDGLFSLRRWFRDLLDRAASPSSADGLFADAAAVADDLLAHPAGDVVLHGDLHHGNVLDFGERGWLAIDPKPVHGDPGFDVANILCNPDPQVALRADRLERTVAVIAQETGMTPQRVLQWGLAWGALSATWAALDGAPTGSSGAAGAAAGVARRARALLAP
ncbi:aminoglycoside phosphotransferase family protein [Leifsonia sp. fls2-241-R2A-40a]|uniref:aminoglycoside phosphotransferase family protein n=1 Tax=Leifsonia sp. fls2-241-R2A-40a TaxID=3040290 RepID=UPI00254AE48F|nr:aminoglycoside phosphotransferase family protein [Leifsonia sp. fls2-241-R2A-40a]